MLKLFTTIAAITVASFNPSASSAGTMLASWYGPGFNGNLTANGERYDMYGISAAHKTLPFGTRLRVCYEGVWMFLLMIAAPTSVPVSLILATAQRKPLAYLTQV